MESGKQLARQVADNMERRSNGAEAYSQAADALCCPQIHLCRRALHILPDMLLSAIPALVFTLQGRELGTLTPVMCHA